ncbi:hypothetical protein N8I77_013406 [Diaporthe amygdali]|uniref:Nephrocystin 3-like N-terminal domain-containing protein n=1 Tax=Phomopsis amygdali TaxID=1214568 RepID=A0AAD9S1C4_PHOAM|nr:hypothetical protein N8I77_013406 [Diaporthe amygdali]
MKVPRENIKSTGLNVIYEPDIRTDVNLDIVFVHGLGGHAVRTWLHTPARTVPAKEPPSTDVAPSQEQPARAMSMKYLTSPNQKKGNTLRKPRTGEASPRLRVFGSPFRPRSVDLSEGLGRSREEITVSRSIRAPRQGSRRERRAPAPRRPVFEDWADEEDEIDGMRGRGTFWPSDLLPDLCSDARVFTWGFQTRKADGQLVPGQLDIFSRGRELLSDVHDLLASYGEHGQRREVVFVAHSTGGIIVKEMLRLAYAYEDTHCEPLLASIAGIVFIGCPMRDSASGTIVEAMKSMAAAAIGVEMHDHFLQELLGGDTSLAYEGRDAFEEIRREYGFQVRIYRETIVIPPVDDTLWPWVALALRRDSELLESAAENTEYIEADHLSMCRFPSSGHDGYRSISSFLLRLVHHQLLRKHHLTPEEKIALQSLSAPGSTISQPFEAPPLLSPDVPTRKTPPWILKHPAFELWYHRKNPQDRHKLLWLHGPAACGKSELLSSIISHIATEWSPATHSSAIITAVAEGQPLLEWVIQKSDGADNQIHNRHSYITTPPEYTDKSGSRTTTTSSSATTTTRTSGPTHETATPLRAILQQLWAHDPRLRNLVGGQAKASSLLGKGADSCGGPARTHSDAGAQQPRPQASKVYSRRPNSGPGDGHGAVTYNKEGSSSQGAQLFRAQLGDAGDAKEGDRTAIEKHSTGDNDGDDDHSCSPEQRYLDDARVVSFFLEDYLRLELPQTRAQASEEGSRAAGVKAKASAEEEEEGDNNSDHPSAAAADLPLDTAPTKPAVVVRTPGTRRIFVFVDIAPTTTSATVRDLLWCLSQLARRSTTLSICVASAHAPSGSMAVKYKDARADAYAASGLRSPLSDASVDEDTMLTVDVPRSNAEDVADYIEANLLPDIEDRAILAIKLAERSRGVMFWLEHAVAIVNDASEDGVSGEIVCSMLDDIAPASRNDSLGSNPTPPSSRGRSGSSSSAMAFSSDPGQARLDDLYAWKLRRLSVGEARAALVLMQWVMLAPEALRLNELLVAIRLTMLVWPQNGGEAYGQGGDLGVKALDIEPPMSLRDLRRRPTGGAEDVPADSPSQFWRWARRISQGLVKLESETRSTTNSSNSKVSSEPLGLQRVLPAHESVRRFFLEGRGFQILTPPPPSSSSSKTKPTPPTPDHLIDTAYYALLHTCLVYLNMTDFDSLSRTTAHSRTPSQAQLTTPSSEPPSEAEEESTRLHRRNTEAQRALVTSSYPLLRYTVDNLTFHLLRPRALRYFPPQARLLHLLTANGCRIWRRWTRLLGVPDSDGAISSTTLTTTSAADAPAAVLEKARARPSAAALLRPVYGAAFRLERVLRRASKTAREQTAQAARARMRARMQRQRSARSLKGGGSGGGDRAPPTPRTPTRPAMVRSASESSVVFALMGGGDDTGPKAQWLVPRSPRSPRVRSDSLGSLGSSPMSNPASPGMLVGIQEV